VKPARAAVAAVDTRPRMLPPIDEELVFDFDLPQLPSAHKAAVRWNREPSGVKAAIVRWLEAQV